MTWVVCAPNCCPSRSLRAAGHVTWNLGRKSSLSAASEPPRILKVAQMRIQVVLHKMRTSQSWLDSSGSRAMWNIEWTFVFFLFHCHEWNQNLRLTFNSLTKLEAHITRQAPSHCNSDSWPYPWRTGSVISPRFVIVASAFNRSKLKAAEKRSDAQRHGWLGRVVCRSIVLRGLILFKCCE